MERPVHPAHDYDVLKAALLIVFGRNVVTQTTTNVGTFGAPSTVIIALLTPAINLLETKNNAYSNNPLLFDAMDTQRKLVVKLLNKLNKVVDGVADGSGEIVMLSGFHKTAGETTPTQVPAMAIIKDSSPVAKGAYYVQVDAQHLCTYIFILCALDAVVTINNHQISVSKGPFSSVMDTHPFAEFTNAPSGDQKLVIIVLNRAGFGPPTPPTTVSVPQGIKKYKQRKPFDESSKGFLVLFRGESDDDEADDGEEDIGYPNGHEGRESSADGKGFEDALEEDVGEAKGEPDTELHADASSCFFAGKGDGEEGEDEGCEGHCRAFVEFHDAFFDILRTF